MATTRQTVIYGGWKKHRGLQANALAINKALFLQKEKRRKERMLGNHLIFDEQWQVDWLIATALMLGYTEHINGNFIRSLSKENRDLCIFIGDRLPNVTINLAAISELIADTDKRRHFINGDEHKFFA